MISLTDLAAALGGEAVGRGDIPLAGAAEPASAGPDQIALAMDPAFAARLGEGRARAAILRPDADWRALGLKGAILAPRPRYVLAGVTRVFERAPEIAEGVHPTALIDATAEIGPGAAIGPFVVVGARVRIGARARVASHASVAEDAVIGADALVMQGVRIGARVRIGDRFIAQPGAVIGGDGFSFVTPAPGVVEEARAGVVTAAERAGYVRINSLGAVRIGDDVEVGANATIDRGTIADTTIGDGTKVDNLVMVAHNVQVGRGCLLCGHTGIAGSAVIGDGCVLGGRASIADHAVLGRNVVITGNAAVSGHVPEGRIMMGYPGVKRDEFVTMWKALRRLPRVLARLE
ncbi:UDP-3-O-(3-hydroxymyristoyl)glucosamine N-acyltransferase [Amaricoccus sp.]|uniref:UDP-3-O-(3-hydroxymyristoyl)glucosamine N-acyltransferase n=1 Tax=Amaricoccus sp. TaxID=1872485 RepID=UPI001B508D11|nr:UDP-3-O-(3-hydroxymyristoyl)glucosamine N-acyltransferase [Amaricoccus sp.]MBP7240980.1 UDP-3-O-(3-hydroxymyristoyl)glucosamine N-acyltransferase [Amaricoccus sp.]